MAEWRPSPAPPTPAGVDVTRVAHRPRVGTRRRELTVTGTRDARLPPHERHAVTVGEGVEALVFTLLPGEQAWSRVAETLSGDDVAGIVQRPMDAAPFHDHRWGRALEALWTAGLDRVYGAVISRAVRP